MSRKHSAISPSSLRAAAETNDQDGDLGAATAILVERGFVGFAWLDADRVARRRRGVLANFVPLGSRITESVAPLIGLDEEFERLKHAPETPLQLPNISLVGAAGASPRMDLQVYWQPEVGEYLLVVSAVLSSGELEIGLAQQVRKRMIAEAELARQSRALAVANADLSRANRDLAEFAYVISHDLKAPLRAMRYFAEDVESALGEGRQEDAARHAAKITTQSRRMTRMLSDLLTYSRIGRQEEALERVDTAELVQGIVASMPRPAGLDVQISGDWPTFETYVAPLDLVVRNLVGNAIVHHDRGQGVVRVACRASADALAIEVADDGPGIPAEWHEAIFLPFKRIADSTTGEGSGIGLALVRRIVESVGAKLTLRSDPANGRGATFLVQWPKVIRS